MKYLYIIFFLFTMLVSGLTASSDKVSYHRPFIIKKIDMIEVDAWYYSYIKKGLASAVDYGADLVILELDTPGGSVLEATKIVNMISSFDSDLIIYINQNAVSAGAYISLASSNIVIRDGGVIGASTPVFADKVRGMKKAPEKVVSVLRADFRSLAERSGRPVKICEAMVDEEIILTKKADGFSLAAGKLLTLTSEEAVQLKVCDRSVKNISELLGFYNLKEHDLKLFKSDYMMTVLKFFSNQFLLGILIAIGILGLIFEVKTAGWGVGGTVGVIALSIFFLVQISLGHSDWKIPLLFMVGITLIGVEVFIIPGFGIVGIAGLLVSIVAIFLSFGVANIQEALTAGAVSVVGVSGGMFAMFRFLPESKIFNRIALHNVTDAVARDDMLDSISVGQIGIAVSELRPVGKAAFGDEVVDVYADHGFIDQDCSVVISSVNGNRIIVKKNKI